MSWLQTATGGLVTTATAGGPGGGVDEDAVNAILDQKGYQNEEQVKALVTAGGTGRSLVGRKIWNTDADTLLRTFKDSGISVSDPERLRDLTFVIAHGKKDEKLRHVVRFPVGLSELVESDTVADKLAHQTVRKIRRPIKRGSPWYYTLAGKSGGSWEEYITDAPSIITGSTGAVFGFTYASNGDLLMAFNHTSNSGDRIFRWNGTEWSVVASYPTGEIVGGGIAETSDGKILLAPSWIGGLYSWDGSDWSELVGATDLARFNVQDIALDTNGDVLLARRSKISRWDGSDITDVVTTRPPGASSSSLTSIAVLANGDILARFTVSNSAGVYRWDGTEWSVEVAPIPSTGPSKIAVSPDGLLIASRSIRPTIYTYKSGVALSLGVEYVNPSNVNNKYSGVSAPVLSFPAIVGRFASGDKYVSINTLLLSEYTLSETTSTSVTPGRALTQIAAPTGDTEFVRSVGILPSGDYVFMGSTSGAIYTYDSDGTLTKETDKPATAGGNYIAVDVLPGGDIVAVYGNKAFRWDGTNWTEVGTGLPTDVTYSGLAVLPDGDILVLANVSGSYRWHRWSGGAWVRVYYTLPISGVISSSSIPSLWVTPAGTLGLYITVDNTGTYYELLPDPSEVLSSDNVIDMRVYE